MTLPRPVLEFLNKKANGLNVARPNVDDELFKTGLLDSFTVADLVLIIEEECRFRIPDGDVNEKNFRSIESISQYVDSRKV